MNIGIGVMLSYLGGNEESVKAVQRAIGQTIIAVELKDDDALHFTMADGFKLRIFDDGQSCCESRYMRTDDDLSQHVGETLLGFEIKDAPSPEEDNNWGEHEVQFLEVKTDKGVFTMASHNEHNGYYGGFSIRAEEVTV